MAEATWAALATEAACWAASCAVRAIDSAVARISVAAEETIGGKSLLEHGPFRDKIARIDFVK